MSQGIWCSRKQNLEAYRAYNRTKQKEYRDKKRGKPAHHSVYYVGYQKVDVILKSPGHCTFCGMLLESEYHKKHPLVGCQKAQ